MAVDVYTTAEMLEVQRRLPMPVNFWLSKFGRVYTSTSEQIMFDELGEEERRLAPFVSPMAQGKVLREAGFYTRSFRPAYLKPKGYVNPAKTLIRQAGEALMGSLSPAQRRDALVADLLASQRSMIERRWDWMAAQAIMLGTVTVSGDEYESVTVDFGRDATLTNTLTSDARWTVGATPTPLADISTMRTRAYDLSGRPINTLVFGLGAWGAFTKNADVKDLLSTQRRGTTSDFRAANLNAGEPWAYEGTISTGIEGQGGYDMWTYRGNYRDDSGSLVDVMNTNDVVGIGDFGGIQAFGAILDMESLEALPIFPKMWTDKDPSVTWVMSQSAPLMVPMRPNCTFRLRVG